VDDARGDFVEAVEHAAVAPRHDGEGDRPGAEGVADVEEGDTVGVEVQVEEEEGVDEVAEVDEKVVHFVLVVSLRKAFTGA
jgi:hypothetical protein